MQFTNRAKTFKWLLVSTGVVVAVGLSVMVWLMLGKMDEHYEKLYEQYRVIKPGMTEEEVVQKLGMPSIVYSRDTAPNNYYVEGWAFKEREITNKLFIYRGGEPIAYIYFDNSGLVEDTFVGGS